MILLSQRLRNSPHHEDFSNYKSDKKPRPDEKKLVTVFVFKTFSI